MNRASLICNCQNEQNKYIREFEKLGETLTDEQKDKIKNNILEKHMTKWKEMCVLNDKLTEVIMNHKGMSKTNWYYITVRPKPETSFIDFIKYVEKFIRRAQIYNYKLTLEQKDPLGSGEGFHMHCIVDAYWKSKFDCIKNVTSSFNKCCADNCIQVDTTRNPGQLFNNYCIEYQSKDEHKIKTKEGDTIWRDNNNIDAYYDSDENPFSALSIKSNKTVQESINPFIVEMD